MLMQKALDFVPSSSSPTGSPPPVLLELRELTKCFPRPHQEDLVAVDRVNLFLREGEILGLVGESGSGKSTLAKLITRLELESSGDILFRGQSILGRRGRALFPYYQQVQMVFQNPQASFDPRHRLGQGIGEGLRQMGYSASRVRERAAWLLEQCGLPVDFLDRYPHELSGGQCQRAAIARALAMEPRILICDEATSALDVTVQAQILDLLRSLRRDHGLSLLFICHNLALVQMFCSHVAVMQRGKIVEQGTCEEVICHPRHSYTRQLLEAVLS